MKKWIMSVGIICLIGLLYVLPVAFSEKRATEESVQTTDNACEIFIEVEGQQEKIPLETYVTGVVAAEMPVSFKKEALKAQAIAARTYALKSTNYGREAIAPTVARQVFYNKEQRKANWTSNFPGNEKKIVEAINETKGQVLLYNNQLITAMFHSTSNGKTESAYGYSGNDLPYLQSVASMSDQSSPKYSAVKEWTLAEWNTIWPDKWQVSDFSRIQYFFNDSGRVERLQLGKNVWSGREVRTLLQIPSTDFKISYDTNTGKVQVSTKGYGHGVGMSQYGAEAMASEGKTANEILHYYYQDIEIKKIDACLK
ncbi:stage II sporulation protein D [Lysinibacillus pakistanensis]|uniref:Stage II sporulation protein D n=1 Tax=Lysinibacillus pakistanensis TaxID=759811 RepID=A0AAX3WZQ9_9BACI|nr:stage II sporulation protein D [Lysinibacillus pakistanensis]MDM5231729.1 stage II sporulation protein D [Lysinibacillus pakistanensis]WHY47269.1 stage II sporulation protein D [Lysinibacillus pakistanensis]WHY52278.1 stage II sporulation protein D [Lysinibacillus pakistanensis]